MKTFIALIGLIFLYLIYGLYLANYDVRILPEELVSEHPRGYFDYKGVTNVHTRLSSGTGDVGQVIAAAEAAGLDWLSITDLNVFSESRTPPSYYSSTLVMFDGQYSYLNSRLLNLDARDSSALPSLGRAQVALADMLSRDHRDPKTGVLVLSKGRQHWDGDYPPGLDGIEIINLKDVWQQAWVVKRASFLFNLFVFPFNEKLGLLRLFRAPEAELRLWDELARTRPVIGLAGADADSKLAVGSSFLKFPSYETLFSLVRNHLLLKSELTGNAEGDADKLGAALRGGHFYVSVDILGDPKGFNAVVRSESGVETQMGGRVRFEHGLTLEVALPQQPKVPFDVMIYRDGERVITSNAQVTQYALTDPGVYRVMVRVIPTLPLPDGKQWLPWIFSNPFYVVPGTRTTKPAVGRN